VSSGSTPSTTKREKREVRGEGGRGIVTNLYDFRFGSEVLGLTPKAQTSKENIDKMYFSKT
jgi:hypothetical protein